MKLCEMTEALNHGPKCYRQASYNEVLKSWNGKGEIIIAHSKFPSYCFSNGIWRKLMPQIPEKETVSSRQEQGT